MKKKVLSLVLVFCMVLTILPISALADTPTQPVQEDHPCWDLHLAELEENMNDSYFFKTSTEGTAGEKIKLIADRLPDEIQNLVTQVAETAKTASNHKVDIEAVIHDAVAQGIITGSLVEYLKPVSSVKGAMTYHVAQNMDLTFSPNGDGTYKATLSNCTGGGDHGEDVKMHWSGGTQPWMLFREAVTTLDFADDFAPVAVYSAILAHFSNLTSVDWPKDENGVCKIKEIGNNFFMTTALADENGVLRLPEGIEKVGGFSFANHNPGIGREIFTVYLPKTMKNVAPSAFASNPEQVRLYGWFEDGGAAVKELGYDYVNLNDYATGTIHGITWERTDGKLMIKGDGEIPDYSVENPAPWSSANMTPIHTVELEGNITQIGNYAFYDLSDLHGTLLLPDTVRSIGEKAFALSESGSALNFRVHEDCTIAANARENREVGEDQKIAASGNYGVTTDTSTDEYTVSDNIKYLIYKNNDGADTYTMELSGTGGLAQFRWDGLGQPEKIKAIRSKITKVIIGDGITTTSYGTFANFDAIREVQFPKTLKKLSSNAFIYAFADGSASSRPHSEKNTADIPMEIPENITYIGNFFGHHSGRGAKFDKIFFANADIKIDGDLVFSGYGNTLTLVVNNSGKDCAVKQYAKSHNIKYKDLTDPNDVDGTVGNIRYSMTSGILTIEPVEEPNGPVVVPSNLATSAANANQRFDPMKVEKIVIKSGVTGIENNAFYGYVNLTQVDLPRSVISIGDQALAIDAGAKDQLLTIELPKAAVLGNEIFKNRQNVNVTVNSQAQKDQLTKEGLNPAFEDSFKVLLIGNSYSEDASNCYPMETSRMYTMLKNAYPDKHVTVGLCYSGGKTMAWHWDKAQNNKAEYSFRVIDDEKPEWYAGIPGTVTSAQALEWADWDVVSLQPYGSETTTGVGGGYDTSTEEQYQYKLTVSVPGMMNYVKSHAPGARQLLYMTWQAASAASKLNEGADGYDKIIEQLINTEYRLEGGDPITVVPVGTAIQNERNTYLGLIKKPLPEGETITIATDPVYGLQRDSGHLSLNVGRYTAALTFAAKITEPAGGYADKAAVMAQLDKLCKNIPMNYPGTIDLPADYMRLMKESVASAILYNDKITDFGGEQDNVDPANLAKTQLEAPMTMDVAVAEKPSVEEAADFANGEMTSRLETLKKQYPELQVGELTVTGQAPEFTVETTVTFGYTNVPVKMTVKTVETPSGDLPTFSKTAAIEADEETIEICEADTCEEKTLHYSAELLMGTKGQTLTEMLAKAGMLDREETRFEAAIYMDQRVTMPETAAFTMDSGFLTLDTDKVSDFEVKEEGTKCVMTGNPAALKAAASDKEGFDKYVLPMKLRENMTVKETLTLSGLTVTVPNDSALVGKTLIADGEITGKVVLKTVTKMGQTLNPYKLLAQGLLGQLPSEIQAAFPAVAQMKSQKWVDCFGSNVDAAQEHLKTLLETSKIEAVEAETDVTGHKHDAVIDLTVKVPVKGEAPANAALTADSAGCIIRKTTWNPAHNPIQASTVYTVTVEIQAKPGYVLPETCKLNGQTAAIKDGKVTFIFPATGSNYVPPFHPVQPTEPEKPDNTNPFVDVKPGDYFEDAVEWAVDAHITTGMDRYHFAPDLACTRAQAVTFLWRAAGCPAPASKVMPFTDVADDAYYHDAVLWAVEQNITKGTGDTTFSPDEFCTRAHIVTFLWRAQGQHNAFGTNPFEDVKDSAYYYDAVLWAVRHGVTTGTSAHTFSPDSDCTRAQIVTFLYRCMK